MVKPTSKFRPWSAIFSVIVYNRPWQTNAYELLSNLGGEDLFHSNLELSGNYKSML